MGDYVSINPFSQKEVFRQTTHTPQEIGEMILLAKKEQLEWQSVPLEFRLQKVSTLAKVLEINYKHYALSITSEMGKLIGESEAEVQKCARLCHHYSKNTLKYLDSKAYKSDVGKVVLKRKPLGLILGIMPWNFPFWQVFRFAIPNLIMGNGIILKHASNVGATAAIIQDAFIAAGFPKRMYTNIYVESRRAEELIGHPDIRAVSLTGSEAAGRSVAAIAGKHLKKTVLELGGSNALLVMPDASVSKAVKLAAQARLVNAGQSCIAAKRILIPKSWEKDFVRRLNEEISGLRSGDPILPSTQLAPLARREMAAKLERQVADSLAKGAKILGDVEVNNAWFRPLVVYKVKPHHRVFREETFGPVFSISSYKNTQEAIDLINASRYGLGASILGEDKGAMKAVADKLEEGSIYFNQAVISDPAIPFGGTKESGFGREMAAEGLFEFSNLQPWVFKENKKG